MSFTIKSSKVTKMITKSICYWNSLKSTKNNKKTVSGSK